MTTDKIQKALDLAEQALKFECSQFLIDTALAAVSEAKAELEAVKKQMIDYSWQVNPDRMGR